MTVRGARGLGGIVWLASPVVLLATGCLAGLRLNLTGSLPVGLYVASRAAPTRGALVLACLQPEVAAFAKGRGYVPAGAECPGGVVAVGKPVVAIAGDTVTVTPSGIVVDGAAIQNSRALVWDRKGRQLSPVPAGRYVVRPATLWIVSSYSRFSFDSRYFGAIEVHAVRATLRRLWTAG